MDARLGVAALLVGAGLLAGCASASSDTAVDDSGASVPAGDPSYALAVLRHETGAEEGVLPTTLADALPNHLLELGHTGRVSSFSDVVVVGHVASVTRGHGVIWRDDDDFTVVAYDDPAADTRTVYVTTTVDHAVGPIGAHTSTLRFRVLVPFAADPQRFAAGLAGLDRIAVVLDRDPNEAESTPWRPIWDDRMVGVVGADGSLTLPALDRGPAFAGDIRTAEDLLAAAREPVTTTVVRTP